MMKLVLSLTLIWTLSSTAGALQCQTCTSVGCSNTVPVTCSSETNCVTAAIQVTTFGTTQQQIIKACAPSSLCPNTDSQTLSASVGFFSSVASAQCCNTDNCNSATLPVPAAPNNNNLQCFTCDPSGSQCNQTLQCKGVEDRCFQVNVTTGSSSFPLFGCASANLCAAVTNLNNLLFSGVNFTTVPSCCETNLCNSVSDLFCIRLGMFHLLLGLLFFILC